MPPSDTDRLADLERAVLALRRDVDDLRTALRAPPSGDRAATGRPPTVAPELAGPAPVPLGVTPRPTLLARAAAYARTQWVGLSGRTSDPRAGGPGPDLEAVVGRYGTVAVAALLILMAVGAFLTWAIATFTIAPATRVAVGTAGAATLATAGAWLRQRGAAASRAGALTRPDGTPDFDVDTGEGTQRFGDVLLALALAVTHVVAWAAGPLLGIVPPPVTLAVAAAASAGLAALAWRARQQTLFLVGVGGALAAPFVTSGITGNALSLRVYGWLVLSAALLAVPTDAALSPRWRTAVRLLGLGGALYTVAHLQDALAVASIGDPAGLGSWAWTLRRDLPALFALACATVPLARVTWWARTNNAGAKDRVPVAPTAVALHAQLALAYLAAAIGALMALGLNTAGGAPPLVALAFLATLAVYATLHQFRTFAVDESAAYLWNVTSYVRVTPAAIALAYPLLLLVAALLALPEVVGPRGAATATTWGALAALVAWRSAPSSAAPDPDDRRAALPSAHAAAASLATALVPVFLFTGHDVVRVALLAAHAAVTAQLLRTLRHPLTLLAPTLVASVAAAWACVLLGNRPAYVYTPFLTTESLAAGAVVLAWVAIATRVWRDGTSTFPRNERRLIVAAATGVALLWGRQELARAVAPDVATFLLIGYFATAGIAAIALGRARHVPAARQVGLALALYAALKALVQASALDAVGLRVASYLVVGGFLLGVGYWYRAASSRRAAQPASHA